MKGCPLLETDQNAKKKKMSASAGKKECFTFQM
jgi:hypothetical protein